MTHGQNKDRLGALALPPTTVQTQQFARTAGRPAAFAEHAIARAQPVIDVDSGAQLMRRFDRAGAPGVWTDAFAQRWAADTLQPPPTELVLAPYVPARRQLRAVRHGALAWPDHTPASAPGLARTGDELPPPAGEPLLNDLGILGWGTATTLTASQAMPAASQNAAAAPPVQRITAPPSATKGAQPSDQVSTASLPINNGEGNAQRPDQLGADADPALHGAEDAPIIGRPSATTPPTDQPPFPTAATRAMQIDRAPVDPLQRMGLHRTELKPARDAAPLDRFVEPIQQPFADRARVSPTNTYPGSHVQSMSLTQWTGSEASPVEQQAMVRIDRRIAEPNAPDAGAPGGSTEQKRNTEGERVAEQDLFVTPSTDPVVPVAQAPGYPVQRSEQAEDDQEIASADRRDTVPSATSAPMSTGSHDSMHTTPPVLNVDIARAADVRSRVEAINTGTGTAAAARPGTAEQFVERAQQARAASTSQVQRTPESLPTLLLQRYGASKEHAQMPLLRTRSATHPANVTRSFSPAPVSAERFGSERSAAAFAGEQPPAPRSAIVPAVGVQQGIHSNNVLVRRSSARPLAEHEAIDAPDLMRSVDQRDPEQAQQATPAENFRRAADYLPASPATDPLPMPDWGALPLLQHTVRSSPMQRTAAFVARIYDPIVQRSWAPSGQLGGANTWAITRAADVSDLSVAHTWAINREAEAPERVPQAQPPVSTLPLLQRTANTNRGLQDQFDPAPFAGGTGKQGEGSRAASPDQYAVPPMALLRPTQPLQRAPAPAPQPTPSAAGASISTNAKAAGAKPDIDALAQQVYARLRRRLFAERERLGRSF